MPNRYTVTDDVEHACCHEAAVLDTHDLSRFGGPAIVGEFASLEMATRVCDLLNAGDASKH